MTGSDNYRDVCIQDLAMECDALRIHLAESKGDRDAYRALAQMALHALAASRARERKLTARLHVLLNERRHLALGRAA